jgi:hypothetical protein
MGIVAGRSVLLVARYHAITDRISYKGLRTRCGRSTAANALVELLVSAAARVIEIVLVSKLVSVRSRSAWFRSIDERCCSCSAPFAYSAERRHTTLHRP